MLALSWSKSKIISLFEKITPQWRNKKTIKLFALNHKASDVPPNLCRLFDNKKNLLTILCLSMQNTIAIKA